MTRIFLFFILTLSSLGLHAQQLASKEQYKELISNVFLNATGREVSYVEPTCQIKVEYDYNWFFADENLHNESKHVACKSFNSFLTVLGKMDKVLNKYMKTNTHFRDVTIVLQEKFDNAFYSKNLGELITMPEVFVQYGKGGKEFSKHPKFLYPIVMHEYAHYVIEKNVGSSFDKYIKKSKNNPAAYLIRSALHEFLADVFAVSMTKDPDTIRNSLYHTGVKQKSKYSKISTRLRSFENHENSLKAIGTRLRAIAKGAKAVISTSEGRVTTAAENTELKVHYGGHNLLTPVRHFVFKNYLSNSRYNQDKGKLISAIMKAVIERMETLNPEDFRKAARTDAAAAYIKINKIFIEAIESSL